MSRAVGAEEAGFGEGPGVPAIGLDLAGAGGVHGGKVGVGDDDLVAEPFGAASHPFAVGGGSLCSVASGSGPCARPSENAVVA